MTPQQEEAIAEAMAMALANQADNGNGLISPKTNSQLGRIGLSQNRTSSAISQMPLQMQHSQH